MHQQRRMRNHLSCGFQSHVSEEEKAVSIEIELALSFLFYISIQLCLCINQFCLTPAIFSCARVLHMTAGIRKDKTSISDFPHGHSLGFIYSQDEQKQMISGTQFAYLYSPALTTQSHFEHLFQDSRRRSYHRAMVFERNSQTFQFIEIAYCY